LTDFVKSKKKIINELIIYCLFKEIKLKINSWVSFRLFLDYWQKYLRRKFKGFFSVGFRRSYQNSLTSAPRYTVEIRRQRFHSETCVKASNVLRPRDTGGILKRNNHRSLSIFCLRKTRSGKSQSVFRPYLIAKPAFSNPSGL